MLKINNHTYGYLTITNDAGSSVNITQNGKALQEILAETGIYKFNRRQPIHVSTSGSDPLLCDVFFKVFAFNGSDYNEQVNVLNLDVDSDNPIDIEICSDLAGLHIYIL